MTERKVTFVVRVPHYWGKGSSIVEAKEECKKAGGRLNKKLIVSEVVHDERINVYVEGFEGNICWCLTDEAKTMGLSEETISDLLRATRCETIQKRGFADREGLRHTWMTDPMWKTRGQF